MKMKLEKTNGLACVRMLAYGLALLCGTTFAEGAPTEAQDVKPLDHYPKVAQRVITMMSKRHILQQPFGNEMSARAWTNLVTTYDYNRAIFLQEDIDRFEGMRTKIDDALRQGDVTFGYDIHRVFVKRLGECVDYVTNLLETAELDFTSEESYMFKRDKAAWPASVEERQDLWRRRIKNEYLQIVLGRQLDDEDEKAGKKTKKKMEEFTRRRRRGTSAAETPKAAETNAVAEVEGGTTNGVEAVSAEKPKSPKEQLLERYRHYLTMILTEIDEETVMQRYMSAATQAYDPHSDYMAPMRKEDFDMDMSLSLFGVGAVLSQSMDDGALEIKEVMKGGPVDREGSIKAGDKIVGVGQGDGPVENITWKPMRKTIRKIRGPKDTKVVLEITDKNGEKRRRVPLIRDEIKLEDQAATGRVETVTFEGVTNRFGYIHLPSFYGTMDKKPGDDGYRSCSLDVAQWVANFNAQQVQGLVLDLRGNGGGSLPESILLSQLFVPPSPVVQIAGERGVGVIRTFDEQPTAAFRKPMIVLVDRHSASASEIVAGCLQDTGRAVVIGDTQTHGKGSVQTVLPMGSEKFGSIKITTARFFRINGSSTQVKGVASDIRIPSVWDERSDVGEDKLPNALPWKAIQPAEYDQVWNMKELVPQLRDRAQKRLAESKEYAHRRQLVSFFKEFSERETVPLARDARLALMRADRAVFDEADEEAIEADEEAEEVSTKPTDAKKDLVLHEAFNVLSDMVNLTGGRDMMTPSTRDRRLPPWLRALGGD